jgi:hypothetical protein
MLTPHVIKPLIAKESGLYFIGKFSKTADYPLGYFYF